MPKISFILPVYKTEKYLERCAKSLIDQSLKDWEAIWVLDGPSEEAKDIITRIMRRIDAKYKIVEIEHGGACKARNEGAKHAESDIWCFFDSDSQIECDAAMAWVDIFDSKPEVGFIYAGYKFYDEMGAYPSEPFDPWMLRVNNFISTCFPFRRGYFPGWNENLKSLQDWDFWLSIVEKGAKGHFMEGYAFATAYPEPKSISGEGCSQENWLGRLEAVKALHNIPIRETCVSSIQYRHEGIRLAKLIDADYRDLPNEKPNRYKTIIQIGFSFHYKIVQQHCMVFGEKGIKNILFWTKDDITHVWNQVSRKALHDYAQRLNAICKQYVEDKEAKRIMDLCGFSTEILPLPLANDEMTVDMPEKPAFLVDISHHYADTFNALAKSMPDVRLDPIGGAQKIEDYNGIVHFHREPTLSQPMKRMAMAGRYVISNVQQPFMGYVPDGQSPDTFIPACVDKIRATVAKTPNHTARDYYSKMLKQDRLIEVINA